MKSSTFQIELDLVCMWTLGRWIGEQFSPSYV